MRNITTIGAAAIAMAMTATACAAKPATGAQGVTTSVVHHHVRACTAKQLKLGYGLKVSAMTGEDPVLYQIRNRGSVSCELRGFPVVAMFTAHGKKLAFRYTHGPTEYIPKLTPKVVFLAPGASAYVFIAKYRCDLGIVANAKTVRLTLPGRRSVVLTGPVTKSGSNSEALSYCKGGPSDHGQLVGVEPILSQP